MKKVILLTFATPAFAVVVTLTAQSPQQAPVPNQISTAIVGRAGTEPPPFRSPESMQAEFIRRFEASPGFGLSRVRRPAFLAPTPWLVWNGTTYKVEPPDLVGLEEEPLAYRPREHGGLNSGLSSTNLSRREIRKLFQHRPLTSEETNAVITLREGRDLVVFTNHLVAAENASDRLAMSPSLSVLGALRPGPACARCHSCDQGSLLGAFSYMLTPTTHAEGVPTPSIAGTKGVAHLLRNARAGAANLQ